MSYYSFRKATLVTRIMAAEIPIMEAVANGERRRAPANIPLHFQLLHRNPVVLEAEEDLVVVRFPFKFTCFKLMCRYNFDVSNSNSHQVAI